MRRRVFIIVSTYFILKDFPWVTYELSREGHIGYPGEHSVIERTNGLPLVVKHYLGWDMSVLSNLIRHI